MTSTDIFFRGPVHITTGSAGCQEHHDGFLPKQPEWSAFRSNDYGYSRMTVFNKTHLNIQQVSDERVRHTLLIVIMTYKTK